jgi:polysaccharide chain length determinant protein (PEP-CTERM system associated)
MALSKVGDSAIETALAVLRRRKWIGLVAFAAMFSLAAPFSVFLPYIYRGTATVIVESPETPTTFVRASVPELETRLSTIQQELLSRGRLSDLITRLNLYPQWRGKVPHDTIIDRMRRDIHVELTGTDQSRGRVTTIGLKITYIGLDPQTAAAVPNTLASLYVQENTKMRERQTGQMAQFLKSQLSTASQELERREARLSAYKRLHSGELPDQVSINLVSVERLNTQLRINSDNQEKARDRRDRLTNATTAAAPDELATLRSRLRDLESKYTDKHPEVIQTRAQISELERQRATDGTSVTMKPPTRTKADVSADHELGSLQREELALRSEIATYNQRIQQAPRYEQDLQTLENDYKTAKESYDSLRGRYEEAQLAESLEQTKKGESFRILDSAVVPTLPAAPNRVRLLFMASFLALVTGVGAMLIAEHLDTSFHSVGELRQFTSVPVLATIPYLKGENHFASQALRLALSAGVVVSVCIVLAVIARHTARENTQLVWMLAGPQL